VKQSRTAGRSPHPGQPRTFAGEVPDDALAPRTKQSACSDSGRAVTPSAARNRRSGAKGHFHLGTHGSLRCTSLDARSAVRRGGWVKVDDVAGSPDGRILCAHEREPATPPRAFPSSGERQELAVAGELRQFGAGPDEGRHDPGVAGGRAGAADGRWRDPTVPGRRAGSGPGRRGRRCWRRGRRAAVPHHRPEVAGANTPGRAAGEASLVLAVRPGTKGARGGCRPAAGLAQQYVIANGANAASDRRTPRPRLASAMAGRAGRLMAWCSRVTPSARCWRRGGSRQRPPPPVG